jgi:hypothetical protein
LSLPLNSHFTAIRKKYDRQENRERKEGEESEEKRMSHATFDL